MSVYKKLMKARIKLQGIDLKKSGENKFAGYKYFELGDFLPSTMNIFYELGLASVVSFNEELATLTIIDTDDGSMVTISSPLSEANLKGAHPIQNLGAVESYQRRYLWMAAMEIVEHDVIDAQAPETKPKAEAKPKVEARPPAKIVGQEGAWQIEASLAPEGEVEEWLQVVSNGCELALNMATKEDDVMQIFKKNKKLFDAVKATNAPFFKNLMAKFTEAKNKFKE